MEAVRADGTLAYTIIFETMEDLESFEVVSRNPSELDEKFYSFMNLSPANTKSHMCINP